MGEVPVGGAVITPGGALQADFLVHVVVQSGEEPVTASGVRKALVNGLRHACRLGVETMAIPPLGTGAGNLDAEAAADVMVPVLREHLEREDYPRHVLVMVTTAYEMETFAGRLRLSGEPRGEGAESDVDASSTEGDLNGDVG